MAMKPYVVRQGDYLTRLAHQMGFDADEVWNHARNETLRNARSNRDILHPGDVLHVPDTRPPGVDISSGGTQRFRGSPPRVDVRVVLHGDDGHALANKAFVAHGMGAPHHGTTDGDGLVSLKVPTSSREVRLVFDDPQRTYRLRIGEMDPASETSGVWKRLLHLGYLSSFDVRGDDVNADAVSAAIAAFQRARSIDVTGEIDDATRDALVDAHGS